MDKAAPQAQPQVAKRFRDNGVTGESGNAPEVEPHVDDVQVLPVQKRARTNVASDGTIESRVERPYSFGVRVESAVDAVDLAVKNGAGSAPSKLGESPALLKTFCQHEVSLPAGFKGKYSFEDADDGVKNPPAKIYPFSLDAFQRESIRCLERHENVLVAAHTSAGKTVVAEYAIAMGLRDKQRIIYTSYVPAEECQ
jgi:superfamily II RNA helicase